MKWTKNLSYTIIAGLSVTLINTSCTSSDINTVYNGPVVEAKSNPLSDLTPSANFSWSTMGDATITIKVNDQFDSVYDYYVDVYTENPATNSQAVPFLTGVARGNFPLTSSVNIPSYSDKVYIKVVDPEGQTKVYNYNAPETNTNITYSCVQGGTVIASTKSTTTRSSINTRLDDENIEGAYSAGYTINFEDQWPSFGDYDLNDVVLHVKSLETVQGHKNYVQSATFTFELMAVGATHILGIGLQFDKILNSSVKVITHSLRNTPGLEPTDEGAFDIHSNDDLREDGNGNELVIIPLAYDAHKLFLGKDDLSDRSTLNTGSTREGGREFTVRLDFNSHKVKPEYFNISNLNFFIYRVDDEVAKQKERVEIHMSGYAPTRNASPYYFGTGNDDSDLSTDRFYTSADNFPWAIVVNDISTDETTKTSWVWPSETQIITKSYTRFADWVNGKGAKDWMFRNK